MKYLIILFIIVSGQVKKVSSDFILQKNYFDKRKNLGNFSLVQLGRMICHPNHVVATHTHLDWFELTSVIDGEGALQANGKSVYLSKGDVYLSFPCETHAIYSSEKHPLKFDFLSFVPLTEKRISLFENLVNKSVGSEERLMRESRIQSLCDGCVNAFVTSNADRYEILSLSLELASMEISGFFRNSKGEDLPPKTPEHRLCSMVKSYIDTHIFSIRNLSELSDVTSYNYSYLSALYKNVTGHTISDYYNEKRFEKAKILLEEGGRSITEIAFLLGYSSVYAFSKAYKDKTGVCPTHFDRE